MILVTGAAGFVGFHVALRLLQGGEAVVGIDSMSDYYGVELKRQRIRVLLEFSEFTFVVKDLGEPGAVERVLLDYRVDKIIHLAAQAGVQYSILHPEKYINSNVVAFANILEATRACGISRLIYASSSSVYGETERRPFNEFDNVNAPVSLYAATKVSNELMAHAYSHLYQIRTIGLRFFTVYGPWGRPDMAYWKFYEAIRNGKPIDVFFDGTAMRDFTYIDDVSAVICEMAMAESERFCDQKLATIYNVGNSSPQTILELVRIVEQLTGKRATITMCQARPGDVPWTAADTTALERDWNFRPKTSLREGMEIFAAWYEKHQVSQ